MSTNISIEDLKDALARDGVEGRALANDRRKAQAFLNDPNIKIVEKIDGTKLTLLRRNNPFDPDDYTKNWYIAYKGNIIYPGEARGLSSREEEVRSSSSGTAQYSLVHSHMARVHSNTASIPPGTEFFLEFVQRKPTISREYPQKHGIFLTLYGKSRYKATGTHLVTDITPEDGQPNLTTYANTLGVSTYPVLFEGRLSSLEEFRNGIRSRMIQNRYVNLFDNLKAAYDDNGPDRPLKIVNAIYSMFSDFQTTLSTDADVSKKGEYPAAEGAVFSTSAAGALYKALRYDQHDKQHRLNIKKKFRAETQEAEQEYWNTVVGIAGEIAQEFAPQQRRNVPEAEFDEILQDIHQECYFDAAISNRLGALSHPKSLIQRQEDLFLTTKSQVMRRLAIGTQNGISVGIFVLAGKPVHEGHWQMIDRTRRECDEALIITSTAGRGEIPSGIMIDAWKAVLEPQFHRDYPNATLIITSESPLDIAVDKMKELKNVVSKFVFYSDEEDARVKYSPAKMAERIRDPEALAKLQQVGVPRTETVDISGTKMRQFIADDDKGAFDRYVPQSLSQEMKDKYWSIIKGQHGDIQDGRRLALRALLESIRTNNYKQGESDMRISERQLRAIVNEELRRSSRLTEAAVNTGKKTSDWLKEKGVQANYTARYKDDPYFVLDDANRGPGAYRTGFGDPFTYEDVGGGKIKVISGPVESSIGRIIPKSGNLIPTSGGGGGGGGAAAGGGAGTLPGCNLASMSAGLKQKLGSVVRNTTAAAFYVDLMIQDALPVQPADIIAAGQRAATMGEGGGFFAGLADAAVGGANELIGACLTYIGTLAQGIRAAKAGFVQGPNKCSYRAFATAIEAAFTNAFSAAGATIQAGFASVGNMLRAVVAGVGAVLAAIGGAIAAVAGLIGAVITSLLGLGLAGIRALGAAIKAAVIAVGDGLIAAGGAVKAAGQAMPESVARAALDRLALEVCTISYARKLLSENVTPENRARVLL